MISEPDVIARRDLLYSLLGDKAQDKDYMRRRSAAHERIITHMRVFYWSEGNKWVKKPKMVLNPTPNKSPPKLPKSMQTKESREEYVRKHLEKEREALGMAGSSAEKAIELD